MRWAGLVVALISGGSIGCDSPETPSIARPDVVLVSIDSLRHDHLGCYGYGRPTSPVIDRLAAEGVRFVNAVSTTSWTLPAHAALFTGLYDLTHGLVFDGLRLDENHVTLAEALRDAGYQTAGFFSGPYLHPTFGLAQGFDTYRSCMTRLPDDVSAREVRGHAWGGLDTAHADVTGPRLLEEVSAWLEGASDSPFFLFLHLWDVHYDYIPPPRYVELFDPDYEGTLTGARFVRNEAIHADMPERDLRHLVALYDGEIRFTDEILGGILERLAARGSLERTLIVVTADHGEEFFEHGGKGHRRTLFDEVLRIPLIIRWPERIEAGRVVTDQVRLIDVMPTVLALAGVPLPRPVQGTDLTPLLEGRSLPPAEALAELHSPRGTLRALRTSRSKVVALPDGRAAFFDLVDDPGEQRPRTDGLAPLAGRLADLVARARDFHATKEGGGAVPTALDPELRARLEALGYLPDGGDGPP